MKAKITNNSKANQGVWSLGPDGEDVLTHIEAGHTRTLTFSDDQAKRVKALPFLGVEATDDAKAPAKDKPAKAPAKDEADTVEPAAE